MKVKSIIENGFEHTWDVSVDGVEEYLLPNGVVSHNTSSMLSNETNGIEPPRKLITIKGSKDGVLPQVAPEYSKLNNVYETLWDVDCRDYLKTVSIFQKYIDQSISCNTSYDPAKTEITMSKLISDLLYAYKLGIKTLYYNNVNDGAGTDMTDDGCESGACKL